MKNQIYYKINYKKQKKLQTHSKTEKALKINTHKSTTPLNHNGREGFYNTWIYSGFLS